MVPRVTGFMIFLDYSAVKQCTIERYVSVDEVEWEIKAGTRAQTGHFASLNKEVMQLRILAKPEGLCEPQFL